MSTTTRVLTFGVVSGAVWSLALSAFDGFSPVGETVKTVVAGILSGVLVSLALKTPLIEFGRGGAFVAGLLSLPLGAFLFGFSLTIITMFTEGTYDLHPFMTGLWLAAISVASLCAICFFPFAILTTFLLRAVILSSRRHQNAG